MSGWRLITGTTGLLGQYLLCESLEKRESTAVLARGQRGVSAAERVDRIVSLWEKRLGILLQRPVVLEGDLRFEGLQLSSADAEWFCHNVTSVLHNAASVRFQESPAGEPMKSNVDGTRNLLQLCRNSRVSEFHYVSTAYSCGQVEHSAPVLEKLHNEAGPFGNIYERSKCLSEHLVASFEGPFSRTIYRPSIIVGESTSGFAPSFNAIYTPLRLASIVITESPALVQSAEDLMNPIGVEGTEVRDLVPVDWVSQAITCTMRNPSAHGGIYHLTNQVQTAGQTIVTAMIQALAANANHASNSTKSADTSTSRMDLEAFRQHMETYSSYFQSDPQFDNSCYRSLATSIPCPTISLEMLTRIFDFAIRAQFQDAEVTAGIPQSNEPRRTFETLIKSNKNNVRVAKTPHATSQIISPAAFRLKLSGPGGGCWWVESSSQGMSCTRTTLEHENSLQVYGSTAAFRSWSAEEFSFEDGLRSGIFIVTGEAADVTGVAELMHHFRSNLRRAIGPDRDRVDTKQALVTQNAYAPETDL